MLACLAACPFGVPDCHVKFRPACRDLFQKPATPSRSVPRPRPGRGESKAPATSVCVLAAASAWPAASPPASPPAHQLPPAHIACLAFLLACLHVIRPHRHAHTECVHLVALGAAPSLLNTPPPPTLTHTRSLSLAPNHLPVRLSPDISPEHIPPPPGKIGGPLAGTVCPKHSSSPTKPPPPLKRTGLFFCSSGLLLLIFLFPAGWPSLGRLGRVRTPLKPVRCSRLVHATSCLGQQVKLVVVVRRARNSALPRRLPPRLARLIFFSLFPLGELVRSSSFPGLCVRVDDPGLSRTVDRVPARPWPPAAATTTLPTS